MLLSQWKRRIWLLWTVPAVSSLTCLAVFGYMVDRRGLEGHARVAGAHVLDEIEQRATTLGRTAFYSPLTPGDGLRFSDDTEVHVRAATTTHAACDDACCTIDWTDEPAPVRGWVTARVPAHFALRKSEPHRERRRRCIARATALVLVNAPGRRHQSLDAGRREGRALHAARRRGRGEEADADGRAGKLTTPATAWRTQLYGATDWAMAMHRTRVQGRRDC